MRDSISIVCETPEQLEQQYTIFIPIQWEQNREEVRRAIVAYRWASLRLRQLAREQAAIDWSDTPEKRIWDWSKTWGRRVFGFLALFGRW